MEWITVSFIVCAGIVIFEIYAGNYRRKKWKTNCKDM